MNTPAPDEHRWFAEQILPHEMALRAWLRSRFPALPDIDDVVQETYARVLQAHSAGHIAAAKSFLFTAARNLALDYLRHGEVLGLKPLTESHESHVLEEAPRVSEAIGRKQELELLTQAIQSLPARCQKVLTLRKIYGLSQKEIAAQLGISENTVEAQVRNGVRRCTEFLARLGLP